MNKTKIGFSLLGIALIGGGGITLSTSLTSCTKTGWYPADAINLDQLEEGTNYSNWILYFNKGWNLNDTFKEFGSSIVFQFSGIEINISNISADAWNGYIDVNNIGASGMKEPFMLIGFADFKSWRPDSPDSLKLNFTSNPDDCVFAEIIDNNWIANNNGSISDFIKIATN